MKKEYYNPYSPYGLRRHSTALDLGFEHKEKDLYLLPKGWYASHDLGIEIDLSASGETPTQILATTSIQLLDIIAKGITPERLFSEQI
jgi:hypothetical protein